MNLDDLFKTEATPVDEAEARRQHRLFERTYQHVANTPELRRLNEAHELTGALERAYRAAEKAEAQGNLVDASTYFRVAADQGIGDASLRLAKVLFRLGEYDEAEQWCAAAEREGFTEARELRHRRTAIVRVPETPETPHDDAAERRRFLAHAAAVTVGMAVIGDWPDPEKTWKRVRLDDVRQIEATTRAFRALDHRYGGIACRAAILSHVDAVQPLLQASCTDLVKERLSMAVADVHNLAGWISFDSGLVDEARTHFARALTLAKTSRCEGLVADILSRVGRMYLHHDQAEDALKVFQLGQLAAQNSGSPLTVARLRTHEAWAYRRLGREEQALKLEAASDLPPTWTKFFAEFPLTELTAVVDSCEPERVRGRTIALTTLARKHLIEGDIAAAAEVGCHALDTSDKLRSSRANDHLRLLRDEADEHPKAKTLVGRIVARMTRAS